MKIFYLFLLIAGFSTVDCFAQKKKKDSLGFFADDVPIAVTMITDITKMTRTKNQPAYQKARWIGKLPDSTSVDETIRIRARGNFRRQNCYYPSLKLNFHNATSKKLYPLNELKMVIPCNKGNAYNQLVLKEYLVYKMYNLLTEKSFKTRLLVIDFKDSEEKKPPFQAYGFVIEPVDDMASRNKCKEFTAKLLQENTDRSQMTLVALFEYMIGNTDWRVPVYHNIKMMVPKKDSLQRPYVVPYDFDFAGIVNPSYASPSEEAEPHIKYVTERWYMGFTRSVEELQPWIDLFNEKREAMNALISSFDLLAEQEKNEMTKYLKSFYEMINDKSYVKRTFIENTNY